MLRKTTTAFAFPVRPSVWNNSPPAGRISVKLNVRHFYESLLTIFKFGYNRTKLRGISHADCSTSMMISPLILSDAKKSSKYKQRHTGRFLYRTRAVSSMKCVMNFY